MLRNYSGIPTIDQTSISSLQDKYITQVNFILIILFDLSF